MKSRLHWWEYMPEGERREIGRRMIARRWARHRLRQQLPPAPEPRHVSIDTEPWKSESHGSACQCLRCQVRAGVI